MRSWTDGAGLLVVALGTLVFPLDSSVNVAFPYIIEHFGVPMAATRLLVVSFWLTSASLFLVCGRIGDLWSYRRVFQVGLAISLAAFIIEALAPAYGFLLLARILQGIGAALLASCGPALSMGLFADHARGRAIGFYSMVVALGMAVGPLIGGWLVESWGWSAVFWFRAPIALLALALSPLLAPPSRADEGSGFDYRGATLLGATIVTGFAALNLAWSDLPLALPVGFLAMVSAVLFVRQQRRNPAPIIDPGYFRSLDFSLINGASLLVNLASFSIMLLVPFYLIRLTDLSVLQAGLALSAHPAGTALASFGVGRLIGGGSPRRAPRLAYAGVVMTALGLWLVGTWDGTMGLGGILPNLAFTGIGLGMFLASYMFIITGAIPPAHRGVAGSLAANTRSLGTLIAASTLFELFRVLEQANLDAGLTPEASFMAGFQTLFQWAAAIPACLVALVALLGIRRISNK